MSVIEYKEVKKVEKVNATGDYLVRVELTSKPDEEWIEAFLDNGRRSLPCPACRIDGKDLVFISGHQAIRGRILGLKRVIRRTNNEFAAIKEVPPLSQPRASDKPTEKELEDMLKKEGL